MASTRAASKAALARPAATGLPRTSAPGSGMTAPRAPRSGDKRITAAARTNNNARQVIPAGRPHHPMPPSVIEAHLDAEAHSHSIVNPVAGALWERRFRAVMRRRYRQRYRKSRPALNSFRRTAPENPSPLLFQKSQTPVSPDDSLARYRR